jgi:glutathione S-transferase
MLRILGRDNSGNVQKVTWLCGALSIPAKREDFGGTFANIQDGYYLALNPNARVPNVIEDDFALRESDTIVRYLCKKYADGDMAPGTPWDHADTDRWMERQQTAIAAPMTVISRGFARTPNAERGAGFHGLGPFRRDSDAGKRRRDIAAPCHPLFPGLTVARGASSVAP